MKHVLTATLLTLALFLAAGPRAAVAASEPSGAAGAAAAQHASLESLDAEALRALVASEAAKGKTVLLVFWATWCGPCIREIPDLVALRKDYPEDRLAILGVSLDQDKVAAERMLKARPVNYRMLHGLPDVVKSYGIRAIPRQIVYKRITGEALQDVEGMFDPLVMRALIDAVSGGGGKK